MFASLLVLSACGGGSKIELKDITKGFKDAGLTVNDEKEMTRDDYGLAPMKAEKGIIFGVEKGQDGKYMNGRLLEFKNEKDLDQTKDYYDKLGKESAMFYSHTYKTEDGKYLLQMNGEISDSTFNKYKDTMIKVVNGNKVTKLANNKNEKKDKTPQNENSSDESLVTTNDGQQQASVNNESDHQGQQAQSGQQVSKHSQQQPQQSKDPNEPTYQEYLNAKQLTENIQNDPQKYQGMGGGPGMGLSHPGQSFESYKQDVTYMRGQSETLQH